MTQDTENETLMEFPCDFSIKAMGLHADDFELLVMDIVRRHIPDLAENPSKTRPSSNGKYLAVTVNFVVQSKEQLDGLYIELSGHDRVMMVL